MSLQKAECGVEVDQIKGTKIYDSCEAVHIGTGGGLRFLGELGLPDTQRTRVVYSISEGVCRRMRGLAGDTSSYRVCPFYGGVAREIGEMVEAGLDIKDIRHYLKSKYPSFRGELK